MTIAFDSTRTATSDAAALAAFRAADFDWTVQLNDVWTDPVSDVPDFHDHTRQTFTDKLAAMRHSAERRRHRSPLGWVLVGRGGSGKTHLLGAMRREAVKQGAAFVLVDMTDVRDFWDILLQGYLDSLQQEYHEGMHQYHFLLSNFIQRLGGKDDTARALAKLANRKSEVLARDINQILVALRKKYPREALKYQDVVRAVVCLNSDVFEVANAGMAWLQGQDVDDDLRRSVGFQKGRQEPREIVRALSWLMSLSGPTVLAFDQLDPIVHQIGRHQLGEPIEGELTEQGVARAIIEQIAGGLAAMPDITANTITVVSCVEMTWHMLNEMVLNTYRDRFERPIRLRPPEEGLTAFEAIVRDRLAPAYAEHQFHPPYPTWPFSLSLMRELTNETPREVLQICEEHRKTSIENKSVSELSHLADAEKAKPTSAAPSNDFAELDARFAAAMRDADPESLLDQTNEDERLGPLFQTALTSLIHERQDRIPSSVDAIVEKKFSGGKTTKPLHARLRLTFHDDNSREEHYCVRALQHDNPRAYQTRLKASMNYTGIDTALKFRNLVIIRDASLPGGPKTLALTEQFRKQGGRFHNPSEDELRTLAAMRTLLDQRPPDLDQWLQRRQPVTRLGLAEVLAPGSLLSQDAQPAVANGGLPVAAVSESHAPVSPPGGSEASSRESETQIPTARNGRPEPDPDPPVASPEPPVPRPVPSSPDGRARVPLGRRLIGAETLGDEVSLPLALLSKHTMILGGSGSGKSVTVRRLVEEAALQGIPSVIIDGARDMLSFDEPSSHVSNDDIAAAERFHDETEMIVWTPGRRSGNPLQLEPLPDFGPLADEPEEREMAVQMAAGGLAEIVAPGKSQKSEMKEGILLESLRYAAEHLPDGRLDGYIELLNSLPPEAGIGVKNEAKLAGEMADSLKARIAKDSLLNTSGAPLDPAILFGDDRPGRGVRISVVSLMGLPSDDLQLSFVNQLSMLLFSWIKKNPNPPKGRPLRGLLVIDEAKDFVPSRRGTACKENLIRLAAQARKYRLALVLATQHPKDIDNNVVGNCATHFYGLNNSPTSLETLEDLMRQKGGDGDGISQLKTGQFFVYNADAGHPAPIKIKVPMSLSFSPKNPFEEADILEKAKRSREVIETGD